MSVKGVCMKKFICFITLLFVVFLAVSQISADTKKIGFFKATAKISGTGSVDFTIDGIYKISDNSKVSEVKWSSATNEGGYQQSDCYVAFRSTVTSVSAKIRIYTDVKNQNTYDPTVSSYTGTIDNYFNGLVGQGTAATGYEESSYSVLPLAWHASTYTCTSADDLTVEGNVSEGNYKYSFMLDKSDDGFEQNNYSTVQWSGHGLRIVDNPTDGYFGIKPNDTSYLYIGCNFNNAMPQVDYAAIVILEAFVE